MGKKKNKKKSTDQSINYDMEILSSMADNLEEYLDLFDTFIIKPGLGEEEYKDAKSKIKKLIKKLRNGEGDDVFAEGAYYELIDSIHRNEYDR